MQVWPRKRAKREYARIRNWPESKEPRICGFSGYKVGMTHVIYTDNRKYSQTKGEDIVAPVTIIECPPLKVCGIRFYGKNERYGKRAIGDVISKQIDKELLRKIRLPKKFKNCGEERLSEFESKINQINDITLIVHTQPKLTKIGKKKPEIFELALGGNIKEKFETAKNLLGKEIRVGDVFKEGQQLDVQGITKGKGLQGPVKRFGVDIRQHKAEKTKRGPATLGPWHPHHGNYRVAHAGKMGYHQRTDLNKWLLKIGTKAEEIQQDGGIIHYGNIKNDYLVLKGSVQGPAKRIVMLVVARRPNAKIPAESPTLQYISRTPKQ